ncbi:hypothetical protein [Streptomyces silvensis]|uniref:Methyl-accepting transducer domain-containing protein n=1 Tax=Streptomyces silvensis TaxID=1765722 RepID=A0A0W7WZP1_9ACTN|nr:hypothetical protein [Streptomyces silvensis]KUF16028.1 hypothetical protein AT728_16770 [Streptomyces silvensis]
MPRFRSLLRNVTITVTVVTAGSLVMSAANATPLPVRTAQSADGDDSDGRSDLGSEARFDRCWAGFALHQAGPETKGDLAKALAGSEKDLHTTLDGWQVGLGALEPAQKRDEEALKAYVGKWKSLHSDWENTVKPLAKSYYGSSDLWHSPEFDAQLVTYLTSSPDPRKNPLHYTPPPGKAAMDQADKVAAERGGDQDFAFGLMRDSASADDIRMFLQYGGFLTQAPAEGSVEERLEIEAVKERWAGCDHSGPYDPFKVLDPVVGTAHMEWQTELASQAKPRADIVDAEIATTKELRTATTSMVESLGNAWVADSVLRWQKYWAGQPKDNILRPAPAVFAKAKAALAVAQIDAAADAKAAAAAASRAKSQVAKVSTAQDDAAKIATAAHTPVGRGLAHAQQSAQVAKASSAAVEAASKATATAANATKATVADSNALAARAETEAHAVQAQFRRVAAQEAAAQAKAAKEAAAQQAKEAAQNAKKAKAAQTTAEEAEQTARTWAGEAKKQRGIAEAEKDNAARERATAASERKKAGEAESRAQSEKTAASTARGDADAAGSRAATKRREAEQAEHRAYLARDEAVRAEREKKAAESRAAALEAAVAADDGSEAAKETRAAAKEARTAADEAAGAATRARSAADDASTAAINARAAATRADAAAKRSQAAADRARHAYAKTHAAAQKAHSAAADAIDAAAAASKNADTAETKAKEAQAAAVRARKNATAAKDEADKATAWAVKTAGYAQAAGLAATAARDTAGEVIKPANEAISLGAPYRQTDSSAGFAVLVGQTSKTMAEQQATAATAKEKEASRAAVEAKALAARAQGDAKLAAEAASAAASDALEALRHAAAARASAKDAAESAAAAKRADDNAQKYDAQAGTDAFKAGDAANDARVEAAGADREATDAERDAASARTAADDAEADAAGADRSATQAERDATAAETSAKNADGAAKEADAAADRAEEEWRKRVEAERAKRVDAGSPDTGPDLSGDEEAMLREICGQQCVDDFRAAKNLAAQDIVDWIKENGGQILLEVFGVDNVVKCVKTREIESCLWALVDLGSIVLGVTKAPAVAKAIVRVASGIDKFFESTSKAKRTLDRFRKTIDKAKKDGVKPKPPCATKPAGASRATAAKFAAAASGWKLPCGVELPELDDRALDNIRDYHFPGGTMTNRTKGQFHAEMTDSDLQAIFEKGMNDPKDFVENKDRYFEKEFSYTGAGYSSAVRGGNTTDTVMLVISKYGDVITMYPV